MNRAPLRALVEDLFSNPATSKYSSIYVASRESNFILSLKRENLRFSANNGSTTTHLCISHKTVCVLTVCVDAEERFNVERTSSFGELVLFELLLGE